MTNNRQGEGELVMPELSYREDGPVGVVMIDNEREQNRLTPFAIGELARIAAMLRERDDVHVLLIRGSGSEHFSTGLLNPVIRGRMSKQEVIDLVIEAASAFDAIEMLPQIVIAGLNGEVRAGGVELALACDIRIAADHVRMSLPEAKWGGFPGAGGPLRLSRLVGRARALELICTGRQIDVQEMEAIGFTQRTVAGTGFDQALREFVSTIAGSGPLAVRGAKKIMKVDEDSGFDAARDMALSLRRELEWSADVDEGLRAHQEGRPPRFTGR